MKHQVKVEKHFDSLMPLWKEVPKKNLGMSQNNFQNIKDTHAKVKTGAFYPKTGIKRKF